MSVVTSLVAFGVQSLVNAPAATAVKLTADWIEKWYTDHSRALPEAIEKANDRAWRALAVALAGDGIMSQIKLLFVSGSDMAIREQVAGFLKSTAHELSQSPVEFRKKCLAELNQAGKERAFAASRVSPEELSNRLAGFHRFSDPNALLDSAWAAAGEVSNSLRAKYPTLAALLQQRTPGGSPLLVMAFTFFFRREVETNAELARGLAFDGMRQLSSAQETGFRQLEDALSTIGPRFDELVDKLDAIEEHVLDIKEELRRMSHTHAGLLTDIISQLNRQGMTGGAVRPNQSFSIRTDSERRVVKEMLARFRQLPVNQQEQLPATLNGLGKLMIGAGDFVAAESAFEEVARSAHNPAEKAEAHFNAYRAALEQKKWSTALEAIEKAADLDAQRYALFPRSRYQAKAILGAGGFGAAFLCVDQFMQADVVVKSLHDGDFDRSADEVFAEARILRKMRHPAIVSVLDTNFADPAHRARPYIVMDHFDGGSLESWLREHGDLPVNHLLEIAAQVADGMKAAHDHGILHRDLKPDNILVRHQNGRWHVCIIDFGLALHRDPTGGDASSTDKSILGGSVAGTMKYWPLPEQQGELPGIKPGTWSDVYTFGKTCCYALFRTTEPRMRHLEKIPVPLRDLLERCIEQELEHRIKDFGEVIERLRACRVPADPIRPVPPQDPTMEDARPKRENRGYDVFKRLLEQPLKREDVITAMVNEGYSPATAASYISWSRRVVDENEENPFGFQVEDFTDENGVKCLRKKTAHVPESQEDREPGDAGSNASGAKSGYDVFMKLLEEPMKREDVIAGMVGEGYSPATAASYITWSRRPLGVMAPNGDGNPFDFQVEDFTDEHGVKRLRKKAPAPEESTEREDDITTLPMPALGNKPAQIGRIYGLRNARALTRGQHDESTRFQFKSIEAGKTILVQAHRRIIDPVTGKEVQREFFKVSVDDLLPPPSDVGLADETALPPVSPEYVLLWVVAQALAPREGEDETRRLASRILNFICATGYCDVEVQPEDYEYLRREYERDRGTLMSWDIRSRKVDLVAKRIRVHPDALSAYLKEESFDSEKTYNSAEPQRKVWFERCNPQPRAKSPSSVSAGAVDFLKANCVRVSGSSPSSHRAPRELDLTAEGAEIVLHIHQPGTEQSKRWVNRAALQAALDQWAGARHAKQIDIPARSKQKKSDVALVFREGGEIEVRAQWWIWVSGVDLKDAFQKLGIIVPW